MDCTRVLVRKFFVVTLIGLVTIVFCLPTAVVADDLPPDDPLPASNPPVIPEDDPVTSPPPDEWVTWPIEEPGLVRPIKEETGPVRIIISTEGTEQEEDNVPVVSPVPVGQTEHRSYTTLLVDDPASYAFFNSLVGFSMLVLDGRAPGE